jgi:hypothetical protein
MGYQVRAKAAVETRLGRWSAGELEEMLAAASAMDGLSARIDFISSRFLGVPYGESTLIGSPGVPEVFVIDLQAVDCFTYLDYVESMRLSRTFSEFRRHLRRVRYRSGTVAYGARRHFFTDWTASTRVQDVTGAIGGENAAVAAKTLNRKDGGGSILPGIPPVGRKIVFIPAGKLEGPTLDGLRTGDYIGIYAPAGGLDVSHVGICIRGENRILLRHASSIAQKVIDQDFEPYMEGKPGIVVLRPRELRAKRG